MSQVRIRPGVATKYVTGLVDLDRRAMIDMKPGNRAADLRRWCANADPVWIAKIVVVATDLAESYRAGCHRTWIIVCVSRIRSMWCAWPTGAPTACAGGCQNRASPRSRVEPINEKRRCSILFHFDVPGGMWQTVMISPIVAARAASSALNIRDR